MTETEKARHQKRERPAGIYLVIDPSLERSELLKRLKQALEGGIDLLQIWNHWPDGFSHQEKLGLIDEICRLASGYATPVLINDAWELLQESPLDGVHFDDIPSAGTVQKIRSESNQELLIGITCTNNLDQVQNAASEGFDYISFCAMFPSASAGDCEIVTPDTVRSARQLSPLPLFASGGITPHNLPQLTGLGLDGVAIISGIMSADSPEAAVRQYRSTLNQLKTIQRTDHP